MVESKRKPSGALRKPSEAQKRAIDRYQSNKERVWICKGLHKLLKSNKLGDGIMSSSENAYKILKDHEGCNYEYIAVNRDGIRYELRNVHMLKGFLFGLGCGDADSVINSVNEFKTSFILGHDIIRVRKGGEKHGGH